jgi:class 3 adenylate cyclase
VTNNPYRWDLVDPRLFYGRQDLAASLLERLLAGDRFAVAGGRRMGKTTLLRKLEAELAGIGSDGGLIVLPVFVDMAELALGGASAEQAYRVLGRRVGRAAQAVDLPPPTFDVTDGPALADALRDLLDASRRRGRLQLVLLFDEIEQVLAASWGAGFLAHCRMLLNNMGELSRCVSAILCGAREIYRIAQDAGSPLGNILAWQELALFSQAETARLAREPSDEDWPDALVARVFEASGGQPCLVQYLMQRVCEADADAWAESLAGAEERFLREHATMFASWWQSFEEVGQAIYGTLADGGPLPEAELIARFAGYGGPGGAGGQGGQGKRALDVLAHTGVVRWDRQARTVEAAGALFGRWAAQHVLPARQISRRPATPSPGPGHPSGSTPSAAPGAAPGEPPLLGVGRRIGTVLFTDIVSSTRMTAELGDRGWLEKVSAHNARVREALATFSGREVKTMGDGFLALFESPAAAIRCACEIAASVRPLGLEIRAGLHAGEYEAVGNDVIGIAISYAAWVMSWAQGGEVFVSETVRGLVAGSGIRLVDRGTHRVKGSRERHRLYAVDHDPATERLSVP